MRKFTLLLALMLFVGMQVTQAQTRTITGTVTNADDGSTIPGVSVVVKGTTYGTTTDLD
jgi:acylphosphatase